jgi:phage-related holin
MTTKIINLLLLILVVSCIKDKSDTRKMVGIWKRIQVNFISSSSTVLDTVVFTKNQLTSKYGNCKYYLANDSLYFILQTSTSNYGYYHFTDKNNFTLNTLFSLGDSELRFTKIK